MKRFLVISLSGFLLLAPGLVFAQDKGDAKSTPPSKKTTPHRTKQAATSDTYRFQSSTAWGDINILVTDFSEKFKVDVKTAAPALGWVLKSGKTGKTVSKGGLNRENQFSFQADQPFDGPFHLKVFLSQGREEAPVGLNLSPKLGKKAGSASGETPEDFQENPDQPYNRTVKGLYLQALTAYGRGNQQEVLKLLEKAEELDPTQPQVQALLNRVRKPADSESGPLAQAREALKKGNKEEALAKVEDYLDEHPDNPEALRLKDKIEGKEQPAENIKKHLAKTHKAETVPKENASAKAPAMKDEDRQAQADQAYNLGLQSYDKGDFSAAKKFWEQTLRIDPNHVKAKMNLDRLASATPDH